MKKWYVFPILFALLTLGCGGNGNSGNKGTQPAKPISLFINPPSARITPGQSVKLTVTAVNTGIIWPDTVAGSYTRAGNVATYQPPSAAGTYNFTVTAADDRAKTATAKITVESMESAIVEVFPKTVTLKEGMDFMFVADTRPEQTPSWNVSGNCGTIAPNGKFHALNAGTCTATASVPGSSDDVTIKVLSGTVNTGTLSVSTIAESLDLPASAFAQCLSNDATAAVNASINEGSTVFGVNVTPSNILLNRKTGKYTTVPGAYPLGRFEEALADLLTKSGLPSISAVNVEKVLSNAHYYGNPDAEIVVLIYSDMLCPYCKRLYNDQTVETLTANYPADVAMVFKNYPLSMHPTADKGAAGLYCAGKLGGDDAYYSYLAQAIQGSRFTD